MDAETRRSLAESGTMNFNMGMAKMGAAGQSPAAAATIYQNAAMQTQRQMARLQDRFDREEFKKLKELKFGPNNDRLLPAAAARDAKLQVFYGPVTEISGTVNQMHPVVDPGALPPPSPPTPGKDGKPVQPPLAPMPPGLQAAGAAPPQGVAQTKELAYYVGLDGGKIPVSSREGIRWQHEADSEYWRVYREVIEANMAIAAEYSSNSKVGEYALGLMNLVIEQANRATTGDADPQKAEEKMRGWEERDVAFDQSKADLEGTQVDTQNQAQLGARSEGELLNAPHVAASRDLSGYTSDELLKRAKTDPNGLFTPVERAALVKAAEKKDVNDRALLRWRKQGGEVTVPESDLGEPALWDEPFRQSPGHDERVRKHADTQANSEIDRLRHRTSKVEFVEYFKGHDKEEMKEFKETGVMSSAIKDTITRNTSTLEAKNTIEDKVWVEDFDRQSIKQPAIKEHVLEVVTRTAQKMRTDPKVTDEDVELFLADPAVSFRQIHTGRDMSAVGKMPRRPPEVERKKNEIRARHKSRREGKPVPTIVEPQPATPLQSATEARAALPSLLPQVEETAPAEVVVKAINAEIKILKKGPSLGDRSRMTPAERTQSREGRLSRIAELKRLRAPIKLGGKREEILESVERVRRKNPEYPSSRNTLHRHYDRRYGKEAVDEAADVLGVE